MTKDSLKGWSDKNRDWLLTIKQHCKIPQTCVMYKSQSNTCHKVSVVGARGYTTRIFFKWGKDFL